jgi:uracil-DNA glycosylase
MEWNELIQEELKKPYFQELITFLKTEDQKHLVLPPKEKRLACFKFTPFDAVKVVIIGQDPYHDIGQAHGLAFSVEQGVYPPSLKNIYKELVDDLKIPYPKTGNLSSWAKQGVLLLNTCLTVVVHQPLSHQNKGWERFTSEVIKTLNSKKTPIVFILWGAHAQKMTTFLTNSMHHIIKSVHPSPLSANRGFFGSKPFSKTNQLLIESGLEPVNWSLNES